MEVLTKGTSEPLMIALRDRLGNITDLDDVAVGGKFFDVDRKEDDASVQTNIPWLVDPDYPMTALCLIDTTLAGYTVGEYKLYLKWTMGSEQVKKGPIFFRVEDD